MSTVERGPTTCPTFIYVEDFLDEDQRWNLEERLDGIPVTSVDDPERDLRLNLAHPLIDGVTVSTRLEGSAGAPVWRSAVTTGPPMPTFLVDLGRDVRRVVRKLTGDDHDFTSVYIDRFDAGGSFVPHTDRACYGPLVAGVSVGASSCLLRFEDPTSGRAFQVQVRPGALYLFCDEIRRPPWVHSTSEVTGRRWVVTLRTAAHAPGPDDRAPAGDHGASPAEG